MEQTVASDARVIDEDSLMTSLRRNASLDFPPHSFNVRLVLKHLALFSLSCRCRLPHPQLRHLRHSSLTTILQFVHVVDLKINNDHGVGATSLERSFKAPKVRLCISCHTAEDSSFPAAASSFLGVTVCSRTTRSG
jgi:hypothetical protein